MVVFLFICSFYAGHAAKISKLAYISRGEWMKNLSVMLVAIVKVETGYSRSPAKLQIYLEGISD